MSFFDNNLPGRDGLKNQILNWVGSDCYKVFKKNQPNPYTEYNITYRFNNHGFRCDDFIPADHRLVFLGCSYTEGSGLPLEETFTHIIYTEIKKRIGKEFPYWNLGLGGCGLDSIVRCYYNFQERLKPQVVIALFPTYRLEYFNGMWISTSLHRDTERIFPKNPYLLVPNVIRYNIEKNLAVLDLLLEKNKTFFIWDTWDIDNFKNVDVSRLKSFQHFANLWQNASFKTFDSPKARDNMHPGKETNKEFANMILDQYGNEICNRLINGAS